ncbi:MAG: transposase, partial [Tannerella sp.]|nr:transposase [Tannerella sp.]
FGQIKFNKQYKRFRHSKLDKITMDPGLLIMAFNINKLYNKTLKRSFSSKIWTDNSPAYFFILRIALSWTFQPVPGTFPLKNAA